MMFRRRMGTAVKAALRSLASKMDAAEEHLALARPVVGAAPQFAPPAHYESATPAGAWQDPNAATPLVRELAALEATSSSLGMIETRLFEAREMHGAHLRC